MDLGARASDCVGKRPNWFSQFIVLGSLSSSKEEERKGKEEGRERKLGLEVSRHQGEEKHPNSSIICVFFWFDVGLKLVLVWVGILW